MLFLTYRFSSLSCFVLGVTSFFTLFLSSSLYSPLLRFFPCFFPPFSFFLCPLFSSLKSPRYPLLCPPKPPSISPSPPLLPKP
ncbi:MAG: hypothetical protein JOS17DRAFT_77418 [Linnemannia elongata]|nr:MAG: hypothetical protein JOS17DRAFT_77418 [Linnemannia elongata]